MKVFFTYGTDSIYPYRGGWSEIDADSDLAVALHKGLHPYLNGKGLNCATMYSEGQFKSTSMYEDQSNLGEACHEHFKITKHACSPGDYGYRVNPSTLKIDTVVVNAIYKDNPELATIDILGEDGHVIQAHDVALVDIFDSKSEAEDFLKQLSRYIRRE